MNDVTLRMIVAQFSFELDEIHGYNGEKYVEFIGKAEEALHNVLSRHVGIVLTHGDDYPASMNFTSYDPKLDEDTAPDENGDVEHKRNLDE